MPTRERHRDHFRMSRLTAIKAQLQENLACTGHVDVRSEREVHVEEDKAAVCGSLCITVGVVKA